MLVVVYALLWILVAAAAGVLSLAGYFNRLTLTVFGFLVSALLFMGIVAVLPWWVNKLYSPKY